MTTNPTRTTPNSDHRTQTDATDRDSQWKDTIDDWDAVLSESGDRQTESTETEPQADGDHERDSHNEAGSTPRSMRLADGSEFVRIGPISNPLLNAMATELPKTWLADTDVQQLVQWVVYLYVTETNPAQATASRIDAAIDRAATRTDTAATTVRYVCTNSLYQDHPGVSAGSFRSDLDAISARVADTRES